MAQGHDDRPVVPDREAKSVSTETTFPRDTGDRAVLRSVLFDQQWHAKQRALDRATDAIRKEFGADAIRRAGGLRRPNDAGE